ncbi:Thioredoxin [Cordylochernes scorpioides]|uniref:Thioredoxin n=1 Tax=Cordylochernes scorpioides TaxID=51811 RepID=A0ABY6L599_9ARAC|nr:Thioredoxin [Cordylochernes scorpioides]
MCADDSKTKNVLQDLENIDDETDKLGIPFVKINDYKLASELGLADELPSLVYYENSTANIFQGDLQDEDAVLKWLMHQKETDEIESITDEILEQLIESIEESTGVGECADAEGEDTALKDLEEIDDDTDRLGIPFVKTDDGKKAAELGIETLPALVYFENATPNVYQGDLKEEAQVLEWLQDQQKTDSIEEVTEKILKDMLEKESALVVLFCKYST